jgi:hypothetical protein
MKKKFFGGMVGILLLLGSTVWAQNMNGYDKVNWGATVADTLKLYPNLKLGEKAEIDPRNILTDFSEIGVKCYEEKNVGGGIRTRNFYFYQDKLFLVEVYYDEQSVNSLTLRNRLESVYGKVTDYSPEPKQYSHPAGIMIRVTISGFYRNVNNNLKVELIVADMTVMGQRQVSMSVRYINPSWWNQVMESYKKADADSVSL